MSKSKAKKTPQEHISGIFDEYAVASRVQRSFTNLSNTVIQTALSGQSKFVFEILQNADDSFDDERRAIAVQFILQDDHLFIHHNGKGFDYDDVERICDYASDIDVKSKDLNKTGYKGLGFKSLFNISDCIHVHSNGYWFRFDKTYWPDWSHRPWQIIPIWCSSNACRNASGQPVNFVLKINDVQLLKNHLQDLVERPELLLYLNHITKIGVMFDDTKHCLEKKVEEFGMFKRVDIRNNEIIVSTWLLKTYIESVPKRVHKSIFGGSRFIYPDKIKFAKAVPFTFALRINETAEEITKIKGLCHSTLPTQLHLTVPYHINSFFILNLDRTQLHENEWNELLIYQLGLLQFSLLKDLAEMPRLKNYVIELFVREFPHPYPIFSSAFSKGFVEARDKIAWIPSYQGSYLLRLGDAWIDETKFFRQNFQNIRNERVYPRLIDYDVKGQRTLTTSEAKRYNFFQLFKDFPDKYFPQLTKRSYIDFISYLYESLKDGQQNYAVIGSLKTLQFLWTKDKVLLCPKNAVLEETENPIPNFAKLNPVDDEYLPSENTNLVKEWLVRLGARRLTSPIQILRESILQWLDSEHFDLKITIKNHVEIMNYLAENIDQLSAKEMKKLKGKLVVLNENSQFILAKSCYFHDAVPVKELADVISNAEKISSCYSMDSLKTFFVSMGVIDKLNPVEVLRKSILKWIKNNSIRHKVTSSNYTAIIEYISQCYSSIEVDLTGQEKTQLREMLVLTSDNKFCKAANCFFESAVPGIKGFESVVAKNKLVSTQNMSGSVYEFLKKIGVSEEILPVQVLQRSVIKWINESQVQNNMSLDNHQDILSYIADEWNNLCYSSSSTLGSSERETLKKIPIRTKCNTLRAAYKCFWPPDENYYEKIPGLESVIPPDEFVSLDYPDKILKLFGELGVRNLTFMDIYEKYCNHLNTRENVKWFFSHLCNYWNHKKMSSNNDRLLNFIQKKFTPEKKKFTPEKKKFTPENNSSSLLAKNGKMYFSTQLYSSRFSTMHSVDPESVPLLDYEYLPEDLQEWLGFKKELDLPCIVRLLEALRKKPKIGGERTRIFFSTLLEQLREQRNVIKSYKLSLLNEDNEVIPAKELYYFREERATCYLKSLYLKRISGMSHKDTVELAELCGANLLHYTSQVKLGKQTFDESLKEFYLARLPFIVLQESKELNEESPSNLLIDLYSKICSIELYKCSEIFIHYPFGKPYGVRFHMEGLKIYTINRWHGGNKSAIHEHLKVELNLKTDVRKIIDMEINAEDKEEWLYYNRETCDNLLTIEKELQKLRCKKETPVPDENLDLPLPSDNKGYITEVPVLDKLLPADSSSDESSPSVLDEYELPLPPAYALRDEEIMKVSLDDWKNEVCKKPIVDDWGMVIEEESVTEEEVESESDNDDWVNDYIRRDSVQHSDSELSRISSSISNIVDHPGVQLGEKHVNRQDKTYLFAFLQDCYKSKYPRSKCNLSGGIFTLRWQPSNRKTIIWLNENGKEVCREELESEAGSEYDCSSVSSWRTPDNFPSLLESLCITKVEVSNESLSLKRKSEEYVFTYLQDYYKNKHPDSRVDLSSGKFTLQWHLKHKIQVIWVNEKEDKGYPYDLLLKKDDETTQVIEVDSSSVANEDSFNLSHSEFVKRLSDLAKEVPQYEEKYCIYRVFSLENPNGQSALYKVVPLKNPQV